MVPAVAVIPGLNEKNVFIVKEGKAVRRAVETGTRLESTVHVLSGLEPGDMVITSGLQQMRVGQAVAVIAEAAP
jgi:membrane fusion protein (multidrug efflux system)